MIFEPVSVFLMLRLLYTPQLTSYTPMQGAHKRRFHDMKLNRLKIANCSRVADIDIEARDNMVLIGPNGSGKTTVLLCLDMLLGMSDRRLRGELSEEFIRDESQPLIVEAALGNLDADELAAFPDEVDALNGNELVVRLEACADEGEVSIVRSFPNSGAQKAPSKAQREAFGWTFLQAQSGLRDIRQGRRPIVDDAISGIDLIADKNKAGNILAVDEPEAHLHPSSQRSMAKKLKSGDGQRILVTHSPTIAGSFEPDEIVVIRLDGNAVQPKKGFLSGDSGTLARWWIGRQLEPLTSAAVIAVEGPSDRIVVNRVATALGFDLDRHDVVVVETSGCGDMKVVESIFGDGGFGIPLYELIDVDARDDAAKRLGVDPSDLEERNVFVSVKDLEDEYVQAIGAKKLWDRMKAANTFSKNVFQHCKIEPDGYPTEASLAQFIREKSNRKIPSALLASELIDKASAPNVKSVTRLLKAVSS